MSSPPDKDYLLKLTHYEEELVSDLSYRRDSRSLFKKLFEACILTGDVCDKFENLDYSRIDHQLHIRYLLRLVRSSFEKDATKWKKFLKLLSSLGVSSSLLDKLKVSSLSKVTSTQIGLPNVGGSSAGSASTDPSMEKYSNDDVLILTEILAAVGYKWEEIAICLRLQQFEIELCREGKSDVIRLGKCLKLWIAGDHVATLQVLRKALSSPIVNEGHLAYAIEEKYKNAKYQNVGAEKPETSLNLTSSGSVDSSLHISKKSRDTVVADRKTTLLMVQANPRESVSYQWKKDGQPLVNDSTYSGVTHDILVISNASPEMAGKYTCCVKKHKEEMNEELTLTVVKLTPKKPQPIWGSILWSADPKKIKAISAAVVIIAAIVAAYYLSERTDVALDADTFKVKPHRDLPSSRYAEHDSSGQNNAPLDEKAKNLEQWLLGRGVPVKWSDVIAKIRKNGQVVFADFLENCTRLLYN